MPVSSHVVEIQLPDDLVLDEAGVRELQASLQSILGREGGRSFQEVVRRLAAEGWATKTTLGWCIEARRGRDFERAVGRTLDEAFKELYQLTRLDRPDEV